MLARRAVANNASAEAAGATASRCAASDESLVRTSSCSSTWPRLRSQVTHRSSMTEAAVTVPAALEAIKISKRVRHLVQRWKEVSGELVLTRARRITK